MAKHTYKITIIILLMFLIAQFLGLWIVNYYSQPENPLPYGIEVPEREAPSSGEFIFSLIIAFAIAITIFFLIKRFKSKNLLRLWFFGVVLIALGIFFTALLNLKSPLTIIGLIFALPLALAKTYKRELITHNLTELMIYPAIGAVFVPFLNILGIIILLILISIYDAWAVWKSKLMIKMAKFQLDEVKVFGGFLIPYLTKAQSLKLKKLRKAKKFGPKSMKVNTAILGGGDVVFPIIASGVAFLTLGILPAIFVIIGALIGLGLLLFFSEKKKFYPAMPFISAGILLFLGISYLLV